eukprot:maker-scaffold_15-snap-gene-10.72-mRNA-1 protein AED:0.13 eAED:0.13 QI:714/1/1/1/1/1/2/31/70
MERIIAQTNWFSNQSNMEEIREERIKSKEKEEKDIAMMNKIVTMKREKLKQMLDCEKRKLEEEVNQALVD